MREVGRQLDPVLTLLGNMIRRQGYTQLIAVLAAVAAAHPSRMARIVLVLSAVVLTADVILLLIAVGPFIGESLLAVSIVAYAAGAFLMSPER